MTRTGIEPMSPPWKGGVITALPTGRNKEQNILFYFVLLVSYPRLERGTTWLKVKCSTTWANSPHILWYSQCFCSILYFYVVVNTFVKFFCIFCVFFTFFLNINDFFVFKGYFLLYLLVLFFLFILFFCLNWKWPLSYFTLFFVLIKNNPFLFSFIRFIF